MTPSQWDAHGTEDEGDRLVVRRAGRYSSEDIHRAVFTKTPTARRTEELKRAIADAIRKKHARG